MANNIFLEDEIGEVVTNDDTQSDVFIEEDIGVNVKDVRQKSPLSFMERVTGGFATEAGKETLYQQKFGKDNVLKMPDGDFIVKQKDENGEELWYNTDPEGFKISDAIGDFADVISEIPTMVLSSAGAAAGGGTPASIAGAGVGGALGEEVKILTGKLLGVRPDDTSLDNAANIAFAGLLNSAFQGVSKIPAVKKGATALGNAIAKIGQKADEATLKPFIKFLTKMDEVHAKRGILRPGEVLTKDNMAPDAIENVSKKFIQWFDRSEKLAGSNFDKTIKTISKNKKIAVKPQAELNKLISRFSEEFDSLAKGGVKIPRSRSHIIGRVSEKIKNGKDLSFAEAQQFKRAISSKINPNAFKSGAVADEINILENKIRKSVDNSIKSSLPFKERSLYNVANKRFKSFAELRNKMGHPKKTEEIDSVKNFLTKVTKLSTNGEDYAFADRAVIQKMQSFDPAKFDMMGKIDDVFSAQEWAKKQGRFDSLMNRAIGLTILGEIGNPALSQNIPALPLLGVAGAIKVANKPFVLAKGIKSKNAVARAISKTAKFRFNPQVAAAMARNSTDEKGNRFDARTVEYILSQSKNLTDDNIKNQVNKNNILEQLKMRRGAQ